MRQGRHETVALAAAGIALAAVAGYLWLRRPAAARAVFDYSDRSGFSRPPEEMRGLARRQPSRAIMA